MADLLWDIVSDEENDLFVEFLNAGRHRRIRRIRVRPDNFNYYDDFEFVRRFRLQKETVVNVHARIEHIISPRTTRLVHYIPIFYEIL